MTKEDFIAGVEFEIRGNFFKREDNTITKVYRSHDRSRVVMEDYHMNIEKIGRVGFESYNYMLGQKVVRKIKFSDLEVFKGI
jgi:hypothetical protein